MSVWREEQIVWDTNARNVLLHIETRVANNTDPSARGQMIVDMVTEILQWPRRTGPLQPILHMLHEPGREDAIVDATLTAMGHGSLCEMFLKNLSARLNVNPATDVLWIDMGVPDKFEAACFEITATYMVGCSRTAHLEQFRRAVREYDAREYDERTTRRRYGYQNSKEMLGKRKRSAVSR